MSFPAMNLLLLLSALLSALSGIGGTARAPHQARAVAGASVVAVRVAPSRAQVAHRQVSALPTPASVAPIGVVPVAPSIAAVPAWVDRRRE
jgi:hypothetical protein